MNPPRPHVSIAPELQPDALNEIRVVTARVAYDFQGTDVGWELAKQRVIRDVLIGRRSAELPNYL